MTSSHQSKHVVCHRERAGNVPHCVLGFGLVVLIPPVLRLRTKGVWVARWDRQLERVDETARHANLLATNWSTPSVFVSPSYCTVQRRCAMAIDVSLMIKEFETARTSKLIMMQFQATKPAPRLPGTIWAQTICEFTAEFTAVNNLMRYDHICWNFFWASKIWGRLDHRHI